MGRLQVDILPLMVEFKKQTVANAYNCKCPFPHGFGR